MEAEVSKRVGRHYDLFGKATRLEIEKPFWNALDLVAKRQGVRVERCIMEAIDETAPAHRNIPDIREYCVRKLLEEVKKGERSPSAMRAPWRPR